MNEAPKLLDRRNVDLGIQSRQFGSLGASEPAISRPDPTFWGASAHRRKKVRADRIYPAIGEALDARQPTDTVFRQIQGHDLPGDERDALRHDGAGASDHPFAEGLIHGILVGSCVWILVIYTVIL